MLTHLPTYRPANRTQRRKIVETFGEKLLSSVEEVLGDVIDVYPFKSMVKDSTGRRFQVIGASVTHNHYFYCFHKEAIYLQQQYLLFPAGNE